MNTMSEVFAEHEYKIGIVLGLIVGVVLLGGGLYVSDIWLTSTADAFVLGMALTWVGMKSGDAVGYVRERVMQ